MSVKRIRLILRLIIALVITFIVVNMALPLMLPWLPGFEYEYELAPKLSRRVRELFPDTAVKARLEFMRSESHDLALNGRGTAFGYPFHLEVLADYSLIWRNFDAKFILDFDRTSWQFRGGFAGSSSSGWCAEVEMPSADFDENDPVLKDILSRLPMSDIEELGFSGSFGLSAAASTTNGLPLATWSATARLSDLSGSFKTGENRVSVEKLRVRAGASGLGPHCDVGPLFPRAEAITIGDFTMENFFASMRSTETAILVTEAGADVLGGKIRLYSLFLQPEKLNAGVTIFVDDIDTGAVLGCFKGFKGSATGRLHGKIPLKIRRGERVSFDGGYLYSVPGETGEIRVEETEGILANLAAAGTSAQACANLDKALRHLDYSVFRMSLDKDESQSYALKFRLEGSATSGETTVPVTVALTLHGDIEQLVNTGLRATMKGK